jgi:replication factor A1
MYDFDTLLNELLRNKPDLDKAALMRMIEEKKATIGAGYLTDQGALFLIAGEFGIQLRKANSSDLTLKDLYIGANDITIVARALAVYPPAQYSKKDGSTGKYLRMNLFDDKNVTRFTAWDDSADAVEKLGVKVDTPVRIVNGYVRQGFDGRPNLNLGRRGKIEIIQDKDLILKMISISNLEKEVGDIGNNQQNILAIRGKLSSETRKSNFTRSDGSPGSLTQFRISNGKDKEWRIVIWNDIILPEMKAGQTVRVTNLRLKTQNNGQSELHGDNGSMIEVIEHSKVVDSVEIASDKMSKIPPTVEPALTKIREVKDKQNDIAIDIIVLSKGSIQDVHLKDGTTVSKGEVTVGDDTGEIRLVAWRDSAPKLLEIEPGERLRISGLKRQLTKMGVEMLELTRTSAIEKIS